MPTAEAWLLQPSPRLTLGYFSHDRGCFSLAEVWLKLGISAEISYIMHDARDRTHAVQILSAG
jgi:hypothetical protein